MTHRSDGLVRDVIEGSADVVDDPAVLGPGPPALVAEEVVLVAAGDTLLADELDLHRPPSLQRCLDERRNLLTSSSRPGLAGMLVNEMKDLIRVAGDRHRRRDDDHHPEAL